MSKRFTPQQVEQIARSLSVTRPGRERADVVRDLAEYYECSEQSIYNAAKRGGWVSGKARRADKGQHRLALTDADYQRVAQLIHETYTEKGAIPLSAWRAVQIAEQSGWIPAGVMSGERLNSWMRRGRVSKKDALAPASYSHLITKHPNHWHMVDASRCSQWYFENERLQYKRRGLDDHRNKRQATKPRGIIRLLLVDHFSGALFPWYVQSETTLDLVKFLYAAWAPKSYLAEVNPLLADLNQSLESRGCDLSSVFPLQGMPENLYSDNGSALVAWITESLMQRLDIGQDTHQIENPQAKGANERMQYVWETNFESGLHHQKAETIDQLNAWAVSFAMYFNAHRKHRRHGATRFDCWVRNISLAERGIRHPPDWAIFRSLVTSKPMVRQVDMNGLFYFNPPGAPKCDVECSHVYRIADREAFGTDITAEYSLFDYPSVVATSFRTGKKYTCAPLLKTAIGWLPEIGAIMGETYRSNPMSESERALALLTPQAPTASERAKRRKARHADPNAPIVHQIAAPDSLAAYLLPEATTFAPEREPGITPTVSEQIARERILETMGCKYYDLSEPAQQLFEELTQGEQIPAADLIRRAALIHDANTPVQTPIPLLEGAAS
jgi:hypothetical protein